MVNRFELLKMRSDNVRSSFSATSIIFGSVVGFLVANGLTGKTLTWGGATLLAVWLFTLAGVAHNLLKIAENLVWHVPWKTNAISLLFLALPAVLIGFYQTVLPIDQKIWAALVPAWIAQTFMIAAIERPTSKELSEA